MLVVAVVAVTQDLQILEDLLVLLEKTSMVHLHQTVAMVAVLNLHPQVVHLTHMVTFLM